MVLVSQVLQKNGKRGFLPYLSTKCINASVYRRHGDVSWTDVQSGLNGRWHKIRPFRCGNGTLRHDRHEENLQPTKRYNLNAPWSSCIPNLICTCIGEMMLPGVFLDAHLISVQLVLVCSHEDRNCVRE